MRPHASSHTIPPRIVVALLPPSPFPPFQALGLRTAGAIFLKMPVACDPLARKSAVAPYCPGSWKVRLGSWCWQGRLLPRVRREDVPSFLLASRRLGQSSAGRWHSLCVFSSPSVCISLCGQCPLFHEVTGHTELGPALTTSP